MFANKWSRQLLFSAAIALALEFAIIYVVCVFITPAYESTLTYALIGLAGLYVLRLANALLSLIVNTAIYYITKKQRVSTVVAMFYHYKVPVNEETAFADGDGLLEAIAASKDSTPEAKRFALMSLGEFSGIRLSNRPLALMRAYSVMDEAWERYRSEVNARAPAASRP